MRSVGYLLCIITLCVLSSTGCVSYLPPSSLHHDMVPNTHPVLRDSLQDETHLTYGAVRYYSSAYHHRLDPEMEDNRALGLDLGYGYADRKQSAGLSIAYTGGDMIDKEGVKIGHSNFISRGSYALDFHEGRWHGHFVKLQCAASRGYGKYQRLLKEEAPFRTQYDLAIPEKTWLYSFGYGSAFHYDFQSSHELGMGFYFNQSTDFDKDGFRAQYFTLDLDYVFLEHYRFDIGGMLDARLTPRGETLYLGLGYQYQF